MTFHELAGYLEQLETTSSRLEITALLARVFAKSTEDEIGIIAYLSLGRLAPKFAGQEFQLSGKSMVKIIARAYNQEESDVTKQFKQLGDMGNTAYYYAKKHHAANSASSVSNVYDKLLTIAQEEGSGSVERKIAGFSDLLGTLDALSVKYVVRIPIGALRLGFSDMTILDALSWMQTGDKSLRKPLEAYFNVTTDIGLVAKEFKSNGQEALKNPKIRPGIPIRPQQAERLGTAEEMIAKVEKAAVEWKLDGFRAQIHVFKKDPQTEIVSSASAQQLLLGAQEVSDKQVMIFSRSMDQTTQMFPEIVQEAAKLTVESLVLDGEAIGYDPKTGKHLPFQETIQRKRIHGIEELMTKIPLRYYAFDLLSLNGVDYLDKPFETRRKALQALLEKNKDTINPDTLALSYQITTTKPSVIQEQFHESVKKGYEGIMVKKVDSVYQAGARNYNWIKFKHMGEGKLADTLDCVVMGMYRGQGKRSGFGIGAFLVGVINQKGVYQTIAKIGTGLSDEQWVTMERKIQSVKSEAEPKEYQTPKDLRPDVWAKPEIVVEIAADEITKSPMHTAGLALRFPRLKRFRDDKKAKDASTTLELKKLFALQ